MVGTMLGFFQALWLIHTSLNKHGVRWQEVIVQTLTLAKLSFMFPTEQAAEQEVLIWSR